MAKTPKEIADESYALMEQCVKYQFNRFPCKELMKDMLNDLYLIICDFDEEKIQSAYTGNHLSALYTKILKNNINSNTSTFYRKYRRPLLLQDELKNLINDEDTDSVLDDGLSQGFRLDDED